MKMVRDAALAFEQQIRRDMFGNLRLLGDARRGQKVPANLVREAERKLADCKLVLNLA